MRIATASRIGVFSLCVWSLLPPPAASAADQIFDDGLTHTFNDAATHSSDFLIVGYLSSNNTALEIQATGTLFQSGSGTYIGYQTSNNALTLDTGGKLTTTGAAGVYIGFTGSSAGNDVVVTGTGSVLTAAGPLHVGVAGGGSNTLSVLSGGVVQSNGASFIGSNSDNNLATVSGGSSHWNMQDLTLGGATGADGNQLHVTAAGNASMVAGTVIGQGGANNSLTVDSGGQVTTSYLFVGNVSGSTSNSVSVSGSGSTLSSNSLLYVGNIGGNESMTVSDGGVVQNTTGGQVGSSSSNNIATITGSGSQWNVGDELLIGNNAGANGNQLIVTAGGAVSSVGNTYVGVFGSSNSLTVSGGGQASGGTNMIVGHGVASSNNTVTVTGAGSLLKGGTTASILFLSLNSATGNAVNVSAGGTLQFNDIRNPTGLGVISNSGGVYQFTTNALNIEPATASLSSGTVSFKNVSGASINNAQVNNIARSGNNAFRLDNSTNATVSSYTFDTGSPTTRYQKLELINGGHWTSPAGTTLTVGIGGAIRGAGPTDVLQINGDFAINRASNPSGDFDLLSSEVLFGGGGNHVHSISGVDLGPTTGGLTAANFAYGTLAIATAADEISLYSGDAAATNALYVTTLDLLGSVDNVANLHAKSGITIYYMPGANPFLLGETYQLSDSDNHAANGGFLVPILVPEPTAAGLLLIGGAGFLARRRARTIGR